MAGEYEPNDSRNVTGQGSGDQGGMASPGGANQQDGQQRWAGDGQQSQSSQGQDQMGGLASRSGSGGQQGAGSDSRLGSGQQDQSSGNPSEGGVQFTPDPSLNQEVSSGQQSQFDSSGGGQMGGGSTSRFADQIREHMEVIGADGVHLGTVDHVDGDRIKLTKADSGMGAHEGHHHYISCGLVAGIEGDKVRLSANGDVAYGMEEEE